MAHDRLARARLGPRRAWRIERERTQVPYAIMPVVEVVVVVVVVASEPKLTTWHLRLEAHGYVRSGVGLYWAGQRGLEAGG